MKIKIFGFYLVLFALITFSSCDPEPVDPPKVYTTVESNITGLADLGSEFVYEAWITSSGAPVSLGTFSVDAAGNIPSQAWNSNSETIDNATDFFITIEPFVDTDPSPSGTRILEGGFAGDAADLRTSDVIGTGDFTTATGNFVLSTPTSNTSSDEDSGIWFISVDSTGAATAGLDLPVLGDGWEYEGWVVFGGTTPVSTGKFTDPSLPDDSDIYAGNFPELAPPFPGEDFIQNEPAGLSFPTMLEMGNNLVVISLEPFPDNSPEPFFIKPLASEISIDTEPGQNYSIANDAISTLPSGDVVRR